MINEELKMFNFKINIISKEAILTVTVSASGKFSGSVNDNLARTCKYVFRNVNVEP